LKRKGVGGLLAFLIISVGAFLAVLGLGYKPLLGLDLQGGVSVVLQPANEVDSDQLDQAIDIIRSRVDALGVAEPDISRQGDTILVQLPGVDNQTRALDLVGQTAELRFRPVCAVLEPDVNAPAAQSPSTTVPADGATTTAPSGATTTVPTTGSSATDTTETGLAPSGAFGQGESAAGLQTDTTDTSAPAITDAPGDTSSTTAPSPATTVPAASPDQAASGCTTPPTDLNRNGITRRVDDKASDSVVLPEVDPDCDADPADPAKCWVARYWLGPTALKGDALSDASATFPNNEWVVNPVFKSGEDGIDKFNAAAAECNSASPNCPTTQLAIVLDGIVISAPQINEPQFQRDQIQITGSFDEGSAKDLALVLRYGSLPVELEPQQTQTVSATLGTDALHAGLVAGFIGLGIATIFMIAYYRLLGVVAIISLLSGAMMLWTIIAYLGETRGLALTLAGVTGIIVSIGVSLDSNVVYYEHLKEDVYNGRTLRSSVDRSFSTAFSTIVKADMASIIGAGILYFLTVGAVRGFAFYLGLAALLDLVAFYFLLKPLVALMVRSRRLGSHPAWFGIPQREGGSEVALAGAVAGDLDVEEEER
jgi:preprotein translocase subunit SecD